MCNPFIAIFFAWAIPHQDWLKPKPANGRAIRGAGVAGAAARGWIGVTFARGAVGGAATRISSVPIRRPASGVPPAAPRRGGNGIGIGNAAFGRGGSADDAALEGAGGKSAGGTASGTDRAAVAADAASDTSRLVGSAAGAADNPAGAKTGRAEVGESEQFGSAALRSVRTARPDPSGKAAGTRRSVAGVCVGVAAACVVGGSGSGLLLRPDLLSKSAGVAGSSSSGVTLAGRGINISTPDGPPRNSNRGGCNRGAAIRDAGAATN